MKNLISQNTVLPNPKNLSLSNLLNRKKIMDLQ